MYSLREFGDIVRRRHWNSLYPARLPVKPPYRKGKSGSKADPKSIGNLQPCGGFSDVKILAYGLYDYNCKVQTDKKRQQRPFADKKAYAVNHIYRKRIYISGICLAKLRLRRIGMIVYYVVWNSHQHIERRPHRYKNYIGGSKARHIFIRVKAAEFVYQKRRRRAYRQWKKYWEKETAEFDFFQDFAPYFIVLQ